MGEWYRDPIIISIILLITVGVAAIVCIFMFGGTVCPAGQHLSPIIVGNTVYNVCLPN